jgi:cyclopropane-fatty-acyl-phospholipid synthase
MTTTQSRPADATAPSGGVAARLEAALVPFVGGDLPVRLRAWDGSEAGPADAPLVELRSRDAVRRLLWHPGELGAAQAYVTGEIEVHHDLDEALTHVWSVAAERGLSGVRPSAGAFARALRTALGVGAVGKAPKLPASQARVRGRLHSTLRDRRAISHHYDLSNEFYSLLLDPSMAYSSGYFRSDDPSYTVQDAQRDKLDLVCHKMGLEPGMRFLDVGCGWGSLSLHAAEHFGAHVTGVTIAAEQKRFIDERIQERGLADRVLIRLQDYREIPDHDFDAVASIEMGEHVGEQNYATYARVLHDAVKPGGRVLVQQMSRAGGRKGHPGGGPFIESFIAPDMHMRPVGETVAFLEGSGLEVRDVHAMREHYVRTVDGWLQNFEANLERLTELVGEEVVRVWRLYLVGGSMAFRDGRMGVDQILMVRPGAPHTLPSVRDW